jgi:hypothetical protein
MTWQILSTDQIDAASLRILEESLANLSSEVESSKMFMRSTEPPEYVRILADLVTWSNVVKIAATAFLAKLGSLAAEDLWKNKGQISRALGHESSRALKRVAAAIVSLKSRSPERATVSFVIPVPDDFPGTAVTCPASSEEEVAVYLACFAMRAERIAEAVRRFQAKQESKHVHARLRLQDNGSFKVTLTEYMRGLEEEADI